MNGKKLKETFRNTAVEAACVLIFAAITYVFAQGAGIIYAAYYNTGKLPTPDVFQAAAWQFTGAISLIYLLMQTKKHKVSEPPKKEAQT